MRIITSEILLQVEVARVQRELDRLIRESHPASGRARDRRALRLWLLTMGSVITVLLLWLLLLGD